MASISRRKLLTSVASGVGLTTISGCLGDSGNEDYPSQPIRVIISWAEGGATDSYARQIVSQAHDELDVDSEFENIDGAGGLRGLSELYNAEPDGYTMGDISTPIIPLAAMLANPGFEVTELEVIGGYSIGTFGMFANPDEEIESFDEVLERYQTGEYEALGIQDEGDPTEVLARVMRDDPDYDFAWDQIVGYGGTAETGRALAAGEVPVAIGSDGGIQSFYNDDQIDSVAMLHSEGSALYEEIPTVEDEGYSAHDYLARFLRGMAFPPDTPDEKQEIMTDAIEEATISEPVQEWEEESGNPVDFIPSSEFEAAMEEAFEEIPQQVDLDDLE